MSNIKLWCVTYSACLCCRQIISQIRWLLVKRNLYKFVQKVNINYSCSFIQYY